MSKYLNKKTTIDGITFDSIIESRYYLFFKEQQNQGKIRDLKLQVNFPIIINDKKICKYIADFTYYDSDDVYHVVDVKSPITAKDKVFRLKKKLVEAFHKIEIEILGG